MAIVLALYLVHTGAWLTYAVTVRRLRAERTRIHRAGEPLKVSEAVPKLAPGEPNAAPLYLQAFKIKPDILLRPLKDWDAAEASRLRPLLAANPHYFALLEQASRIPKCAFQKNWDAGTNLKFPELARFREAAYLLEARVEVQTRDGRLDDAAQSCLTVLRLADHAAQDPSLVSYLVSVAIQGISIRELSRVFSAGDPTPATCRALYAELDKRRSLNPLPASFQSERAFGLAAFDQVLNSPPSRRLAHLPPSSRALGKLPFYQDELYYLDRMNHYLLACHHPYPQARAEMLATVKEIDRYPKFCSIMTRMLTPIGAGVLSASYHHIALAGAAQIATAAKAYKATHGNYPASLHDLTKDGWRLPADPFTRRPYHYAREGRGLAVWSVGPDLVDNHGVDWNYKYEDMPGYKPGFDYVFRCSR